MVYPFPSLPLLPPNITSTTENYYFLRKTLLLIIHLRLSLRNSKSLRTKKVYGSLETFSFSIPTQETLHVYQTIGHRW